MQSVVRNNSIKRFLSLRDTRAFVAAHLGNLAVGGVLWLFFVLTVLQPLHLAQEVHALLPASAEHHAALHCEEEGKPLCEAPQDDVSQPLSSRQHERHHEAKCSGDVLFSVHLEPVNIVAPSWDTTLLHFVPVSLAPCLEVPASPKQSRAPPPSERTPLSLTLPSQSGRAPPIGI